MNSLTVIHSRLPLVAFPLHNSKSPQLKLYEDAKRIANDRIENGLIIKENLDYEIRNIQFKLTGKVHGFDYDIKKW